MLPQYLTKLARCLRANCELNGSDKVQCTACHMEMESDTESIGYSIHHLLFGKDKVCARSFKEPIHFLNALARKGKDHFMTDEPCKVYCRPCHADELKSPNRLPRELRMNWSLLTPVDNKVLLTRVERGEIIRLLIYGLPLFLLSHVSTYE